MDAACSNCHDDHDSSRLDEHDEVLVVTLAHAGAQPRTVVVQALDTAVADAAVDGARRTVDVTG